MEDERFEIEEREKLLATFGHESKAGQLINKLFAKDRIKEARAKITYPKVKIDKTKRDEDKVPFFAGKLGQKDPREDRKVREKQKVVKAPKVGTSAQHVIKVSEIEGILRRRYKEKIIARTQADKDNGEFNGKPKVSKLISTEKEKDRLSALNYFSGGGRSSSILPPNATFPKLSIPIGILARKPKRS